MACSRWPQWCVLCVSGPLRERTADSTWRTTSSLTLGKSHFPAPIVTIAQVARTLFILTFASGTLYKTNLGYLLVRCAGSSFSRNDILCNKWEVLLQRYFDTFKTMNVLNLKNGLFLLLRRENVFTILVQGIEMNNFAWKYDMVVHYNSSSTLWVTVPHCLENGAVGIVLYEASSPAPVTVWF